ncbi:MAG TPA: hypothetical protein VMH88_15235 [Gemmatimonadales bacterium]|nr:hypothetical protein [Gemmatimonadales bacterium]
MPLLAAAAMLLQSAWAVGGGGRARDQVRAGLDTLYAGEFAQAASAFTILAAQDTTDPAPVIFSAGAYIWWAAAKDSDDFESRRIDSLLDVAVRRARAAGENAEALFWLGTALGYRARQEDLHGHAFAAAKDARAMRDAYRQVLAADSLRADCYLGLGLYNYGLARAGAISRFLGKLIGLGSGDAALGMEQMERAARSGDLARVEATWVLASALKREATRKGAERERLIQEARGYVDGLAVRYPANPVFQRFLAHTPEPAP